LTCLLHLKAAFCSRGWSSLCFTLMAILPWLLQVLTGQKPPYLNI